jgi:hypothetical protein
MTIMKTASEGFQITHSMCLQCTGRKKWKGARFLCTPRCTCWERIRRIRVHLARLLLFWPLVWTKKRINKRTKRRVTNTPTPMRIKKCWNKIQRISVLWLDFLTTCCDFENSRWFQWLFSGGENCVLIRVQSRQKKIKLHFTLRRLLYVYCGGAASPVCLSKISTNNERAARAYCRRTKKADSLPLQEKNIIAGKRITLGSEMLILFLQICMGEL